MGLFLGLQIHTESKDKFSQIFDILERDYVDSLHMASFEKKTIDNLLSSLDPHSTYIPASLTEYNNRQIRGNYEGLGISYISFRDTLLVYQLQKDFLPQSESG